MALQPGAKQKRDAGRAGEACVGLKGHGMLKECGKERGAGKGQEALHQYLHFDCHLHRIHHLPIIPYHPDHPVQRTENASRNKFHAYYIHSDIKASLEFFIYPIKEGRGGLSKRASPKWCGGCCGGLWSENRSGLEGRGSGG